MGKTLVNLFELINFTKVFSHHCLTLYGTCMHPCILCCAFISTTMYLHTIGYVPEQNLSHINKCTMMLYKTLVFDQCCRLGNVHSTQKKFCM